MKNKALAIAIAATLSGCSAPAFEQLPATLKALAFAVFASQGQTTLRTALQQYEDGDYAAAAQGFHTALAQGLPDSEQVLAHKHLAFIHCAAQRPRECRAEFRLALSVNPSVQLDPAEAGHPAWGPVFSSVRR